MMDDDASPQLFDASWQRDDLWGYESESSSSMRTTLIESSIDTKDCSAWTWTCITMMGVSRVRLDERRGIEEE